MTYPCLLITVALVLAAGNTAAARAHHTTTCRAGGFDTLRPTPITERLRQDIALQSGTSFRGLVATFDRPSEKPGVSAFDLVWYDFLLWQRIGNDLRSLGLWAYNIPTLFQYSPIITPPYYLLLTDFLARPADMQVRNMMVLTQPNERMLKLWGVRYMITDFDPDFGTPVIEMEVSEKQRLRLIQLSGTNLGDYSPTEVRHVADFREGLQVMHESTFDGRRAVVVDEEINWPLVPATGVKLTYQKTGFSVQASSTGRSLLVLPVQYSRCWTVSGSGDPRLVRANLMQLGVSFEGRLDANLVFRFGPILASQCRINDIRDVERLRIREARGWRSENGVVQRP